MSEMFDDGGTHSSEPTKPTANQSGIEATPVASQEEISELPDSAVIGALKQDTEKMEQGVTDEETFGDSGPELEEAAAGAVAAPKVTSKSLIEELVAKSNKALRTSGTKKGAWRVQPTDSNNPPSPDAVLRFIKSAKLVVVQVVTPGKQGSASTKFNTYIVTRRGVQVKASFVYGQGRNEGQKFEETALNSIKKASTGKLDNFSRELFGALGVNPLGIATVNIASSKRVKRPISNTLENVGPMISDIDIHLKDGSVLYVSLKNESGVTFANSGYKGAFVTAKKGTKVSVVANPHRLDDFVVSALGVNKMLLAAGITDYANKTPTKKPQINVSMPFDAAKIKQYLASAYGYGYWYVRQRSGSKVDVVDLTTAKKMLAKLGEITGVIATYPFWTADRATKQMTVKIATTTGNYIVEIRNSQSGVEPTEIKVKIGGAKK